MAVPRAAAPPCTAAGSRLSTPAPVVRHRILGGSDVPRRHRVAEAVAVAVVGAVAAGATGWLVGVAIPAAVVGLVHGWLAGYRRIYPWRRAAGVAAFVLDHSWALLTTTGSVLSQAASWARRDSIYIATLSERQARHVFAGGYRLRKGFAITVGTTVSGLADASERRWKLVTDHEDCHVWQARLFGPLYVVLYVGWMITAAVAGTVIAVTRRRPLAATVEAFSYYNNPFEWWAYSREGRWPPPRLAGHVKWRGPIVQSLSAKRESRAARR